MWERSPNRVRGHTRSIRSRWDNRTLTEESRSPLRSKSSGEPCKSAGPTRMSRSPKGIWLRRPSTCRTVPSRPGAMPLTARPSICCANSICRFWRFGPAPLTCTARPSPDWNHQDGPANQSTEHRCADAVAVPGHRQQAGPDHDQGCGGDGLYPGIPLQGFSADKVRGTRL